MGVLQMEVVGRPDGETPHGRPTYLEWITEQTAGRTEPLVLTDQQRFEIDREFLQFYHRRICCLALRLFDRAVADADHTLALMDFVAANTPSSSGPLSHEQYRPFVWFHRIQAAVMSALERSGPAAAVEELDLGLARLRRVFEAMESTEVFDENELVVQLLELKDSLRKEYRLGPSLAEQLSEAVANEEYERAARLRDEIARRSPSAAEVSGGLSSLPFSMSRNPVLSLRPCPVRRFSPGLFRLETISSSRPHEAAYRSSPFDHAAKIGLGGVGVNKPGRSPAIAFGGRSPAGGLPIFHASTSARSNSTTSINSAGSTAG